jgi:glycosyltransferase involved in cell wall biosynthesis
VVAAFARAHDRASVFAAAHDADFFVDRQRIRYLRDRLLYRWGVRRMDRIVVQTERQAELCRAEYGRDSIVIPSCYAHVGRAGAHDGPILWVATAKRYKRPHLFVELARRLPEYRFRLVGGPERSEPERRYHAQLVADAAGLPNLELVGFVPYADVEREFDGASLFVNTSIGEGFPNTFLQAWSRGIPTLSFFDPQSTLDGVAVGCVVRDLDAMAAALREFKRDPARWREDGARARALVERRHSCASVADAYQRVLISAHAGGLA